MGLSKKKVDGMTVDHTRPRVRSAEVQAQFEQVLAMNDGEIDLSDAPEVTEEEWATAVRGNPFLRPEKVATAVRLDADVVHWLKAQGRGYQTRLNAYLRRMMTEELQRKAGG